MGNELEKHKAGDTVKWIIAFTLIAVLLIGMVGMLVKVMTMQNVKDEVPSETVTEQEYDLTVTPNAMNSHIKLTSAMALASERATNYTTYTVTAAITPSTATNKTVDWSLAWAEPNSAFAGGKKVTDYMTVTPTSDGALTATVTCIKAFEGDILLTVTTREGGYTADCVCSFIGKPTSVTVSSSQVSRSNGTFALSVGVTYNFDISQDNAYHSVGAAYKDFSVSCVATGDLTVGTYEYDPRGSKAWYSTKSAKLSDYMNDIITYTHNGNTLQITLNKSIDGYYSSMVRTGTVKTYYDMVKSVDSECYFTFYVNNQKTGVNLQDSFKVVVDTTSVSGVSITGLNALEF